MLLGAAGRAVSWANEIPVLTKLTLERQYPWEGKDRAPHDIWKPLKINIKERNPVICILQTTGENLYDIFLAAGANEEEKSSTWKALQNIWSAGVVIRAFCLLSVLNRCYMHKGKCSSRTKM